MRGELPIENGSPVRAEGIDEAVLDGKAVLVGGVELAMARRSAEMDSVRSTVTSAVETWGFAGRFQEHRAQGVA